MNAAVWTDGSGKTGGPAGIAFVANVNGRMLEGSLPIANATNQQAEILAVAWALDQLDPCDSVIVYSDSEYVVKGLSEWMPNWIRRGWRTAGGSDVKNRAHWERLLGAKARHAKVQMRWCKGHAGTPENERADVLAVQARYLAEDLALEAGVA